MTRNAASTTWAADVTPLLRDVARDGSASLMVVPAASAVAPLGFDVQLRAPQLQSEVASGPSPAATTSTTTSTTSPPSSGTTAPPSPPPSPTSPTTSGSDGSGPAAAITGRDTVAPAPSTSTMTPLPAEEAALRAITQPRPLSPPPPEGDQLPGPWWQAALAVLIGDLLALGRQLALRAQRAQRASMGTYSRLSGPA